jgi:hypothetical protein
MCDKLPKAVHIFFGSAMGPLDLALGTVATRAGSVYTNASSILIVAKMIREQGVCMTHAMIGF